MIEVFDGELVVNGRPTALRADADLLDTGSPGPAVPRRRVIERLDGREHAVLRCADSRYWGFVSDAELVGRAVVVWFHFKRFGDDWGVHLDRIGTPVS